MGAQSAQPLADGKPVPAETAVTNGIPKQASPPEVQDKNSLWPPSNGPLLDPDHVGLPGDRPPAKGFIRAPFPGLDFPVETNSFSPQFKRVENGVWQILNIPKGTSREQIEAAVKKQVGFLGLMRTEDGRWIFADANTAIEMKSGLVPPDFLLNLPKPPGGGVQHQNLPNGTLTEGDSQFKNRMLFLPLLIRVRADGNLDLIDLSGSGALPPGLVLRPDGTMGIIPQEEKDKQKPLPGQNIPKEKLDQKPPLPGFDKDGRPVQTPLRPLPGTEPPLPPTQIPPGKIPNLSDLLKKEMMEFICLTQDAKGEWFVSVSSKGSCPG